jgi:hypothetical protein
MKSLLPSALLALSLVLVSGCDSTIGVEPGPELPPVVVAEISSGGLILGIYSNEPLSVGHNHLYIHLTRADESVVNTAEIEVTPIMTMTEHSHASPVYHPACDRGESGLFEGAVIFTMPTGSMGTWRLEVQVTDLVAGATESFTVPVDIMQSSRVRVLTATDEQRYVITYVEPREPEVGLNDFVLAIHERQSMLSFPAVTDLRVEIEPWMPSMDHGSHNNEHPQHTSDGFYHGKVNFNMSGDWRIYVRIYRGEEELLETHFDLQFS